jgi:cystathionine gamma-synthase
MSGTGRELSPETLAVHAGRPERVADAPLNQPLVLASVFHAGGDIEYGRHGNPTWHAFETAIGALEGGLGLAFSTGLAAVGAVLSLVPADGIVVVPEHAYLGTLGQLGLASARTGLRVRHVDVADTEAVIAASDGADLVFLESPTNPALEVADLPATCAAAKAAGALVAVDNTFATPFGQTPITIGADLALHSATKFIAGHSDAVLGALVCADSDTRDRLKEHRRLSGTAPGTLETWLALRGLRTLHLRLQRAVANAAVIAPRLAAHPACRRVRYPGLPDDPGHIRAATQMRSFGSILSVEFADGPTAERFCAATRLWVNATSLGAVESTLERRRRWAGESPTIPEGLVRFSVGIEDAEDLWADLEQALAAL